MKQLLFFVPLMLLAFISNAQSRWYATAGAGGMNYFGDLQPKQVTFSQMLFGATAGLSFQPEGHLSGNFALSYGAVKASDSKNGERWFYRNLSFQSNIFEISATAQYDFFALDLLDDVDEKATMRVTPYIFAGLGLMHFNPFTYDQAGKKAFLQPLGTEGQSAPYSLWSVTFPIGIGIKYSLSERILISGEFNMRKTLTDYLDDVSQHQYADSVQLLATRGQESASLSYRADEIPNTPYQSYGYRGNPGKKDGFYTFTIKLSYLLFERPKFYVGY